MAGHWPSRTNRCFPQTLDSKLLKEAKQDIILATMYPSLDIEVSKHLNHLLKSPFCVHPATGRVCVPINVAKVDEFNPLAVPTVSHLLQEIDDYELTRDDDKATTEGGNLADYEKTSLAPYIRVPLSIFRINLLRNNWEKRELESRPILTF